MINLYMKVKLLWYIVSEFTTCYAERKNHMRPDNTKIKYSVIYSEIVFIYC
jgi:hypothetical protein